MSLRKANNVRGTASKQVNRDNWVFDKTQHKEDFPHEIALRDLVPRIQSRARDALSVDRVDTLFFQRKTNGRRCSCFLVESSPDGQCQICFIPGTLVRAENGYIPIENIKIGDNVLSSDGKFHKVTNTFKTSYTGELIKIYSHVSTKPIFTTPDHPFLVMRGQHKVSTGCGPKCDKYINMGDGNSRNLDVHQIKSGRWHARAQIYGKNRKAIGTFDTREEAIEAVNKYKIENIKLGHELIWKEAKELEEKDWLTAKWPLKEEDLKEISIPVKYTKQTEYSKERFGPNQFGMSVDFLWMLGMYLAEGSAGNREIFFSLHRKEKEFQQRLINFFSKHGYNPVIKKSSDNGIDVCVRSTTLAQWFPDWLGKYCHIKKIPEELMRLPVKKLRHILLGVFDGDGSKSSNEITQTSEILALQLAEILHRLGEQPLVRQQISNKLTPKGNKRKLAYCISWAEDTLKHKNRKNGWFFKNKEVLTRIKDVGFVDYCGPVYNLEVEGDHTYVVNGIVTHNCHGTGIVGGYTKFGTVDHTIDVTHPGLRTLNVRPLFELQTRPVLLGLENNATYGFIDTDIEIRQSTGIVDTFNLITRTTSLTQNNSIRAFVKTPSEIDFVPVTYDSLNSRISYQKLTIRIEFNRRTLSDANPILSHFFMRAKLIEDLKVRVDIPRDRESITLAEFGIYDSFQTITAYFDSTVQKVGVEDFVFRCRDQELWKVVDSSPNRPLDILTSHDVSLRLVQTFEPYVRVPIGGS